MNKPFTQTFSLSEKTITAITFAWLLITYHLIFREFFPLPNGRMGHDYAQFMPKLIDDYFWFMNNGLFSPPWFSPAFCGGQVNFADPQSMYYSLPQFLVFVGLSPIQAIYLSFLTLASAGFLGMYLLTKHVFKFSHCVALTCAAIFMYNGYFTYRMLIGHLTFHGFILIPLISYLLLNKTNLTFQPTTWLTPIAGGLLLAYWCSSGLFITMLPCIFSILVITLMYLSYDLDSSWILIVKKSLFAAIVALSLSASKLVGSITLTAQFPRTQYHLPGFENIIDILKVFFYGLFLPNHYSHSVIPLWKNNTLLKLPVEHAYGITIIPLVIIATGLLIYIFNRSAQKNNVTISNYLPLLLAAALIPFLINYYSPSWNDVLKKIPIISATTSPLRWLIMYIFITIIISGIIQNGMKKYRGIFSFFSILAIPILVFMENKTDYNAQPYDATTLEKEFIAFKSSKNQPAIVANIMVTPTSDIMQNSHLVQGADALNCYNPLYGYSLEMAEFKTLAVGPVMALMGPTTLNIRNPACIIYPQENNCKLWDNFSTDQADMAEQFVTYKPFAFERSHIQRIADTISTIAVGLVGLFFLIYWLVILNKNRSSADRSRMGETRSV